MKPLYLILIIFTISTLLFGVYIFIDQKEGGTLVDKINNLFPSSENNISIDIDNDLDMPDVDMGDIIQIPDSVIGDKERLFQITNIPIAGFIPISYQDNVIVRYMEKGRSHIYDFDIESQNETIVSNKTREGVQNAVFGNNGNSFIMQYPKETQKNDVLSFLLTFKTAYDITLFERTLSVGDRSDDVLSLQKFLNQNEETQVSESGVGSFGNETNYFGLLTSVAIKKLQAKEGLSVSGILDKESVDFINRKISSEFENTQKETGFVSYELVGVNDITISPDKKSVLYSIKTQSGASINSSAFDNKNISNIYNSKFTDWRLFWPEKEIVSIITASSQDVFGYLFFINTKTGIVEKILSEIKGLTALVSPNASKILYSKRNEQGNGFDVFVYDVEKEFPISFSAEVLPEKCLWSQDSITIYCAVPNEVPQGIYPDSWYQGIVSFSDSVWKINTETGVKKLIHNPEQESSGLSIDAIKLTLSRNESFLFFINKKDSTLWGVSIGE